MESALQPADTASFGPPVDHHLQALSRPVDDEDHQVGVRSAPVQLVEYGDYECPFCAQAVAVVRRLINHHGDELLYVFRHFPLVSQHPHAFLGAVAAEAAGEQGRFWDMHERLLADQGALDPSYLIERAQAIGLDIPRFKAALSDPRLADRVRRDARSGLSSGVLGTPSFFVNGGRIEGGLREAELEGAIQQARMTG